MKITKVNGLKGEITIPGDKSISHRSIMLGALANGTTTVKGFLMGEDCLSTIDCFRKLGIEIDVTDELVTIHGKGLHGLTKPDCELYTGNSGTTTRIISGILAGQDFECSLNGDESIQKRPMKRIMEPLSKMGANIESEKDNGCAPLRITGSKLHGMDYTSKVASAQVKSAILFAGLYADSPTSVSEPTVSRNHTELMMEYFGGKLDIDGTKVTIKPGVEFEGRDIEVPGDISSAAFFIVAGLITPNSEILIKNVGINPTRDGIIKVCQSMGGDITLLNEANKSGELTADILVKTSKLHGTTIEGEIIPTLIDELPVIAVMASFAEGQTVIKDAAELRVKESDRIELMVNNLSNMGVDVTGTPDGMIINGGKALTGTTVTCAMDHRIAMSMAIAGINAENETSIPEYSCVNVSYPGFFDSINSLKQ